MQHQEKKSSYKPLAIVLVFCLVMAFAQNRFIPRPFDALMYPFMGYFFLLLSLFKFFDLNAFATAFSTYDLIASRWIPYGYIYPFIEFVLGMLFVSQMELFIANSVTVIVEFPKLLLSNSFVRMVARQLRLSLRGAASYIAKNSFVETAVALVSPGSNVASSSLEPALASARNKEAKKIKTGIRNRRVALRGLRDGSQYRVTYRVVLKGKREYRTRTSVPTVFTAQRP
jgi:hypothetical protein